MHRFVCTLSLASVFTVHTVHAWVRFRGRMRISSEDKSTPVSWSPDKNLKENRFRRLRPVPSWWVTKSS